MTSEMPANEMLEHAKRVMQEPKEGYGRFAEQMAKLPPSRERKPAVKQEIDYKARQTGSGKATVKREPELVPPPSVAKPKAAATATTGRGPRPELAPVRTTLQARTTEKAAKTVAAAGGDAAALADVHEVLEAVRKERDAFQTSSLTNLATVTALQKKQQLLEEGSEKKDEVIEALREQLKEAQGANADLDTQLKVVTESGKRTYKKLGAAEAELAKLRKRKREDDPEEGEDEGEESEGEGEESEGEESEGEESEGEGSEDESAEESEGEESEDEAADDPDDPDYDLAVGEEQERQDDEDEEEEEAAEAMQRAIAVFAKHRSQGAKGSSAAAKGDTGPQQRKAGRLNKEDKILYERPTTAFPDNSLPLHSVKEIPYLFTPKESGLPGWNDQGAMVAWARAQYTKEGRKDSHACAMVQNVLDLFALPNPGTTYYEKKDFLAFIEYFATWTLPENEPKSGLSGGRHFLATRLYPDFFTRNHNTFVRPNCKDAYEQKKLEALREKVNKYWGCIWWWNRHLKINHKQRKVN